MTVKVKTIGVSCRDLVVPAGVAVTFTMMEYVPACERKLKALLATELLV